MVSEAFLSYPNSFIRLSGSKFNVLASKTDFQFSGNVDVLLKPYLV